MNIVIRIISQSFERELNTQIESVFLHSTRILLKLISEDLKH